MPISWEGDKLNGPNWYEDLVAQEIPEDFVKECGFDSPAAVHAMIRDLWELECFIRALDSLETLASTASICREYVVTCEENIASIRDY
jgi:nuclear pore complex protein Nup107